jgi:hypothetical protein
MVAKRHFSKKQKQRMAENYSSGQSLKRVAHEFDTATTVVRKILTSQGVCLRSVGVNKTSGCGSRRIDPTQAALDKHLSQRLAFHWKAGRTLDVLCKKANMPRHMVLCFIARETVNEKLLEALRKEIENGVPYKDLQPYRHRFLSIDGVCSICNGQSRSLAVDHDHATGVTRGLLCSSCNTGLGHFKDSVTNLKQAIKYLKRDQKNET